MGDPVFQFLHAADLHLDTQPDGLHGYPDHVADSLRDASLGAFERLVDVAIERQVAFCLFAGDIYDGAERGLRAELAFRSGLIRLAEHGIRSFIVHGNHDPLETGWVTVRDWPDEVTVFAPGDPQTVRFEVDGTTVAVHGVSYATRATTENLAVRFSTDADADLNIGLLHANVGARAGHDPYAPCSVAELQATGIGYWALGHIHTRETVHERDPWVVYPGNLQGRSPKPSERGPKGALVVSVEHGAIAPPEFVELDVVRFVSGSFAIDEFTDPGELHDALLAMADQLTSANPGRPLVLRSTATGRGELHGLLARRASRDELLVALREEGLGRHPYVWWDRLDDQTAPAVDLESLAADNDFTGHALRWFDDPSRTDELLAQLPDLGRLDVDVPDPTDPEILHRARMLVAQLLTEGRSS